MEDKQMDSVITEDIHTRRSEKVETFRLDLNLDDEIPDVEPTAEPLEEAEQLEPEAEEKEFDETDEDEARHAKRKHKKGNGCLGRIIYGLVVLLLSAAIAYFLILFLIDAVALNRSDKPIDVEIPAGATTEQIATILDENGVIDQPLCFRIFSKLTRADGKYQKGAFTLTADMDYSTLVDKLQTTTPRETVTVTIPEGYTIDDMAKLLEDNGVCDKESFYEAVISTEYDYDFVKAIPTAADGEEHTGRIYLLEGYLFPDTYNFYVGSSGKTVVDRMLENFDLKLSDKIRAEISKQGMTIDEAIILASIIQGEAAKDGDMLGVSRVLHNRLAPGSGFAKLQCDSTGDYVRGILPSVGGIQVTSIAYDTYEREGLPVGAINNPGLKAIESVLYPSEMEEHMSAYFFATDYDTEITYFTKTLAEHERICRLYGIGMYG